MRNALGIALLVLAIGACALNIAWIVALKDYSYAGVAAPFSLVGAVALIGVIVLRWRKWVPLMVVPLSIPFLPWVEWMYA